MRDTRSRGLIPGDALLDLDASASSSSRLAMISKVTDRLVKTLDFNEALQNLIDGATDRCSNIPLGVVAGHRFVSEPVLELEREDLLVLSTDGVLEAADARGRELGREGLVEILADVDRDSTDAHLEAALDRVAAFRVSSEPLDDYTLMLVKKLG